MELLIRTTPSSAGRPPSQCLLKIDRQRPYISGRVVNCLANEEEAGALVTPAAIPVDRQSRFGGGLKWIAGGLFIAACHQLAAGGRNKIEVPPVGTILVNDLDIPRDTGSRDRASGRCVSPLNTAADIVAWLAIEVDKRVGLCIGRELNERKQQRQSHSSHANPPMSCYVIDFDVLTLLIVIAGALSGAADLLQPKFKRRFSKLVHCQGVPPCFAGAGTSFCVTAGV